jgi:siderophore synthetase component
MAGGRYLTMHNKNFVIKKKNGTPQQLFYWDAKDKTIHTLANRNLMIDIAHEGKDRDLIAHKKNARWD